MEMGLPTIDWSMLAPVATVALTGVVVLIIEMFRLHKPNTPLIWVSLAGLGLAAYFVVAQFPLSDGETFNQMLLRDRLGLFLQLVLIGVAALTVIFSETYLREKRIAFAEFYPLVLWATCGAMIIVSTQSLLMLYLGIEMFSISMYCLVGMSRSEVRSEESAIKYLLLGAFASAFLLYGIAFLYGATGSTRFEVFNLAFQMGNEQATAMALFAIGLMMVGLGFKAAVFPFHQWSPDVYQGAPTNVTAYMAVAGKIAAFGAMYRVLDGASALMEFWLPVLIVMAILTMTVGNLAAMAQKDVKRVLAYSGVAHGGYMLVALIAHLREPDRIGATALVFYLLSYAFMTLGAFAVLTLCTRSGRESTRFQDLHGLFRRAPVAAVSLVIFVVSLIGIPVTAGFWGKLLIFNDAVNADLMPLAIALALNSAISAYYYIGIIKAAFVEDEGAVAPTSAPQKGSLTIICLFCAVAVMLVNFAIGPVSDFVDGELSLTARGAEVPE